MRNGIFASPQNISPEQTLITKGKRVTLQWSPEDTASQEQHRTHPDGKEEDANSFSVTLLSKVHNLTMANMR